MNLSIHDRNAILPLGESHFLLSSPAGYLEVRSHSISSKTSLPCKVLGVICHPHPQLGGNMDNKVVTTLSKAFNNLEYSTIRFNFRGVGASSGHFDHGIGEREDLISILKWLNVLYPQHSVCLAGFSFGSFIAASAADYPTVNKLILVAPPVERFTFQKRPPFQHPWFVIQGEEDEVVTPTAVWDWLASCTSPYTIPHYIYNASDNTLTLVNHTRSENFNPPRYPIVIRLPGAGHFFHGQLISLRQIVTMVLNHPQ